MYETMEDLRDPPRFYVMTPGCNASLKTEQSLIAHARYFPDGGDNAQ